MTAYKIIACDMDETLLSSDASICQRNIEIIQKAVAQGVKFVPCTGLKDIRKGVCYHNPDSFSV